MVAGEITGNGGILFFPYHFFAAVGVSPLLWCLPVR